MTDVFMFVVLPVAGQTVLGSSSGTGSPNTRSAATEWAMHTMRTLAGTGSVHSRASTLAKAHAAECATMPTLAVMVISAASNCKSTRNSTTGSARRPVQVLQLTELRWTCSTRQFMIAYALSVARLAADYVSVVAIERIDIDCANAYVTGALATSADDREPLVHVVRILLQLQWCN